MPTPSPTRHRRAALALALALDAGVGEPPTQVHPVVAMGRLADRLERRLPAPDHPRATLAGGIAWAAGLAAVTTLGAVVDRAPWPVRGVVLWTMLSGRLLATEVLDVEAALVRRGLPAARARAGRLVSRPTDELTATEVRMAAIESVAENLSDALVAPLAWWVAAGLPGAVAYRWINTLDAQWGYRSPAWERRGRVAARADDVANLVPARLTGWLLRARPDPRLRSQAGTTPSPNAGWPMAAMALGLDVRLEKRDTYTLHAAGHDPGPTTVARAVRRAVGAGLAAAGLAWLAAGRRWAP